MLTFEEIYKSAVAIKGGGKTGKAFVEGHLPEVRSADQLGSLPDAYFLSEISRRIFRAGLKHSMVDGKWLSFETAFWGFDPMRCAMMSDDELDEHMGNADLIRHYGKMKSIRHNAQMVLDKGREAGSFGEWLVSWPEDDAVGLWLSLKRQGAQLGGQSGARFLRQVGYDTFLLTDDVVSALIAQEIVSKRPTAQRDLKQVQLAFNGWREESGRPLAEISRIISFVAW
ncbi:DNA-3-methyladenine glycosylase I [Biformimicrobium ophioploci]|uniref:DNA-3-methyladenine glycosylase I n=1 Tax=Biformimicrobium ophioploci TaxID=3036711 RepID=A0ABQ6LYB1_9GAMM|nr:DNA-3-methyladenine glycosylase I [Microbulbifer sp. NKW57]GMG87012.1 DNA-3-methyladenine glycosylase I [Microbulbifer sp. NKW57]